MHDRWLSRRALKLHLALIFVAAGCLVAWWWQVTRALGGNDLSYVYAVEWPIFCILAIVAWWILIHSDPETIGAVAQRHQRHEAEAEGTAAPAPARQLETEDAALAAYNDRLAALAREGPNTWRRTAETVVRQEP